MPITSSASWAAQIYARIASPEGLWGLGGCAMACASGGFALYMTMNGPASGPTSHDFPLFASVSARVHRQHFDPAPVVAPAIGDEDIDPVVTGSIPGRGMKAKPPGSLNLSEDARDGAADKKILLNVILRQVDGDNALVEINDRLMVYKIGDQIPGAGQFVAMTQQNGHPALETSTGLIVEAR
jgi:hypothetical protein